MVSASDQLPSGTEILFPATTPLASSPGSPEDNVSNVQVMEILANNTCNSSFAVSRYNPADLISHTAAADVSEPPLQSTTVADRIPDWNGIWRDTGFLFGSQIVAAGIIYMMPESVSNWSSEQKKNSFKKYSENVVNPGIDIDKFYINYLLHPYWGATYYIRARDRGLDKVPSLVYSTLISAMYEFGVESFFEKPSIQDLIVTPVIGSFFGAFVFEPWREAIKSKQVLRWYDHAILIATDPVGVLSLGFEKMFGIKSSIMVEYSTPQLQSRSNASAIKSKNSRFGVVMQFPLNGLK